MPTPGEGTLLEVNDGASSAFVSIPDAVNITPPGETYDRRDRNRLAATFKERSTGLPDPGQMSFQYELTDSEYVRMNALKGVSKSYRVTFTNGLRLAVTAVMESNTPDQVQAGADVMATCQLDCRSLITVSDTTP